ncbi:hypothetical protein IID20_01195 [Patescibacteria group bacterium]|nr:hypothetical protein [Patescibacteria group bacterium]
MVELIKFGDIFRHKEKEYVFLAKTENIIYAAQILDKVNTKKIHELYKLKSRNTIDAQKCEHKPLFCYVLLSTEEFKERMTHLYKPEKDESSIFFDKIGTVLNTKDLQDIKEQIIYPNSPVALELKEIVSKLDIQKSA